MQDFTGFQRDCLVAIAGPDGPPGLEVTRDVDGSDEGEIDHGRRNHPVRAGWEHEHVESNG